MYNFTENSREYRYSTSPVCNALYDKEISKRNASTKASKDAQYIMHVSTYFCLISFICYLHGFNYYSVTKCIMLFYENKTITKHLSVLE